MIHDRWIIQGLPGCRKGRAARPSGLITKLITKLIIK
jgi:hypothetical protein